MSDEFNKFEEWFVKPLNVLAAIEHGSGAFVALATALFLYERYHDALRAEGRSAAGTIHSQLMTDFGITEAEAREFWDVFRNGLLHKAMPKQREHGVAKSNYLMDASFAKVIELTGDSPPVLKVQPWKFINRVVELWKNDLALFDRNTSFPAAKRFRVEYRYSTGGPDLPPEIVLIEET